MALKGNLRDFSITQLLNLINLARKTGSLVVEGPRDTVTALFREGKLAYASHSQGEDGLGAVLYKSRMINKAQYTTIKARAAQMSDKELGLLLINSGYVTHEKIITSLKSHFADILSSLFTWREGFFQFDADGLLPDGKIPVGMDLENLIIEGSRRVQEWEQLQDEIPNLDMALKFADRPGVDIKNVNLSAQEWKVVSYINPKNSIQKIARAIHLDDLQIRRIVYSLLQAGLVEMVRHEGARLTLPTVTEAVPGETREEQKNLVNRIIDRIRSL